MSLKYIGNCPEHSGPSINVSYAFFSHCYYHVPAKCVDPHSTRLPRFIEFFTPNELICTLQTFPRSLAVRGFWLLKHYSACTLPIFMLKSYLIFKSYLNCHFFVKIAPYYTNSMWFRSILYSFTWLYLGHVSYILNS